jgi:hypothetical protein
MQLKYIDIFFKNKDIFSEISRSVGDSPKHPRQAAQYLSKDEFLTENIHS